MTARARPALIATALLLIFTARSEGQTSIVPELPADFPQEDGVTWAMVLQKGLAAKVAARRLAADPASPEALHLLIRADRPAEALDVLARITRQQPERLPEALRFATDLASQLMGSEFRERVQPLRDLVPVIRSQLARLPREEAARAARHLLTLENRLERRGSSEWAGRLDAFRQEYAGTEAALIAEVEAISARSDSYANRFAALEAFGRAHPGTAAAARALYLRGWDLALNGQLAGIEPPRGDPLKRLLMVQEIVTELESGKYPRGEWTDTAADLIARFSAYQPTYEPGSIDRMLSVYERFATSHFGVHPPTSMSYFISQRIGDLHALKGNREAGVERLLTDIGRNPAHAAAARYMLAEFYLSHPQIKDASSRSQRVAKAREILTALHAESDGLYQRKALAKLAGLESGERNDTAAIAHLKAYLSRYPDSPWAWMAAMRLGHAHTALGESKAALAVYSDAAKRFVDVPPARVLAHAYAARAHEALGHFDASLKEHEYSLKLWDDDFGDRYPLFLPRQSKGGAQPPPAGREDPDITKTSLEERVSSLRRRLSAPGAATLERARWLFARAQFDEALAAVGELLTKYPRSPLADEGRELRHRVRVVRALDRADAQELESLSREPFDFWVAAATMVRAGYAWKAGEKDVGEALMMSALMAWQKHQPSVAQAEPPTPLERDVLELRNLVFRPRGDRLFQGTNWELKSLSPGNVPFFVARQTVGVKVAGAEQKVRVDRPMPEFLALLFWNADQLAFFDLLLAKVGGTDTRKPVAVMEVPNQPVGGSMVVLDLLKKFFPARPGHWGGWMVETFPTITQIEFTDAARTKAAVRFTVGYEGATAIFEKKDGVWTFKEMTNRWIT